MHCSLHFIDGWSSIVFCRDKRRVFFPIVLTGSKKRYQKWTHDLAMSCNSFSSRIRTTIQLTEKQLFSLVQQIEVKFPL
ncbi:uncharacterized protein V6R79_014501 [Siganus canaliculatus]